MIGLDTLCQRRTPTRMAFALGVVALAFVMRQSLIHLAGGDLPPYITFYPSVMVVALLAGLRAGLVATGAAALLTLYWILPPQGNLRIQSVPDALGLVLFGGMGLFMSVVAELYLSARRKAAAFESELALRHSEEARIETETRFRNIVEKSRAGYFHIDQEGLYHSVNSAWLEMHGYGSSDEVVGKPCHITWPEGAGAGPSPTLDPARGALPPAAMARRRRKDGSLGHHVCSLTPVTHAGEVVGLEGFLIDTTDRVEMEERLLHMQKMEAIGHLAGGVAHDFNNQLTAILGCAELLIEQVEGTKVKRFAENIRTATLRSAGLTQKLLAFSRKGQHVRIRVDLHKLVDETAEMLTRSIDKRIRIVQDLEARHHVVIGDPSNLQNALLNLALNARDAMPDGGSLTFSTRDARRTIPGSQDAAPGHHLVLAVADTGCGMADQVKKRLFEPFFTTKGEGRGTGLGLASVHASVDLHGGEIRVESEIGRGTQIEIFLEAAPEATPSETGEIRPPTLRRAHVLVVDDEALVRQLLSDILEGAGHQVTVARDGVEAVEIFRAHAQDLDLVILDLMMPELGGRESFTLMRMIHPRVPFVFASGYAMEGEAQALLDAGACGFLQKPFRKNELLELLAHVVQGERDNRASA